MWTIPNILNRSEKNGLYELVRAFSFILAVSYIASFGARFSWALDLFSHFTLQYMVGGIILGILLLAFKKKPHAFLLFLLAALNIFEIYWHVGFSLSSTHSSDDLTIVQYNRNYGITDNADATLWLNNHKRDFDVIVFQEAQAASSQLGKDFIADFPYQIHEPQSDGAFGMVIISKHPFVEARKIDIHGPVFTNFLQRLVIQPDGRTPIAIYALHTLPPLGNFNAEQRNTELKVLTKHIVAEKYSNVIAIGDWNITPYSPYFSDVMKATSLKYEYTGFLPFTTWPYQFSLPFLQIPIDHILSKGSLQLTNKHRGDSLGSDHYSVVASFRVPEKE